MSRKTIICRCEDVTLADIEEAVAGGYRDIEEVKRYTGLGTGPCQGKECMATCAFLLAVRVGPPIVPFTVRPPIQPVALSTLAGEDEERS